MLEDLKPKIVKPKCKVGRFHDELDTSDQKLLDGYLADIDFTTEALVRSLRERKLLYVSPNVMALHRKGNCACSKLR